MLDYSDEEQDQLVQPFPRSHQIHFHSQILPPNLDVSYTNPLRTFRKRGNKLDMETGDEGPRHAFFVSELMREKNESVIKCPNFRDKTKLFFKDPSRGVEIELEKEEGEEVEVDGEAAPDSFYNSHATLVFLAQFFAIFPVSGIFGRNYESLCFKWIHYKTFYWASSLLGTVFMFFVSARDSLYSNSAFQAASKVMFFGCGILSSVLMLNLSRNWPTLNKDFAKLELKLRKYGYPVKIGRKFKVFTICVFIVALVEHILSKVKSFEVIAACSHKRQDFLQLFQLYFLNEYSEVFALVPYSLAVGFVLLASHLLATINWNFKDLFLCTISYSIGERFKQINEVLNKAHGEDRPIRFWREVRQDYNHVSVLTKKVDSYINKLLFLSMGNNLFFICIQLFYSLKRKEDSAKLIYFFMSFGFLVVRTGLVAFSAARINDESKEPKTVLYSVPQKNYSSEVRRFLTQLTTNEVALTGSGFFSITRSLILTITGSVITYEIVLVQFGSKEIEADQKNITCSIR